MAALSPLSEDPHFTPEIDAFIWERATQGDMSFSKITKELREKTGYRYRIDKVEARFERLYLRKEREKAAAKLTTRPCINCRKNFQSPDPRRIQLCDQCRRFATEMRSSFGS